MDAIQRMRYQADILERSLVILETKGHGRHYLKCPDESVCALGAMETAVTGHTTYRAQVTYNGLVNEIAKLVCPNESNWRFGHSVGHLNDSLLFGRTRIRRRMRNKMNELRREAQILEDLREVKLQNQVVTGDAHDYKMIK